MKTSDQETNNRAPNCAVHCERSVQSNLTLNSDRFSFRACSVAFIITLAPGISAVASEFPDEQVKEFTNLNRTYISARDSIRQNQELYSACVNNHQDKLPDTEIAKLYLQRIDADLRDVLASAIEGEEALAEYAYEKHRQATPIELRDTSLPTCQAVFEIYVKKYKALDK